MTTWIFDNSIDLNEYIGFVYIITNTLTGQAYIGKKQVWTYKKSKRDKESNWKRYWSSSDYVKADVKLLGEDKFTREVLYWCKTRGELAMKEVEEQFKRDVLTAKLPNGDPAFYNRNIMNRFFTQKETLSEEHKRKIGAKSKGRKASDEARRKQSEAMKGKPSPNKGRKASPETCAKIGAKSKGRVKSPETREKVSAALKGIKFTDEHKSKISAALKDKPKSDIHRARVSAARKAEIERDGARPHTSESRSKISAANRKFNDDQIAQILSSKKTKPALAKEFNTSWQTINRLIENNGYRYRPLHGGER